MAYKINVPSELKQEYQRVLTIYNNSGDYAKDLYGDTADSFFGGIMSEVFGETNLKMTKELFMFVQSRFNYLIVGKDIINLLSVKNN